MDASVLAVIIGGVALPFVQEAATRGRVTGRAAVWLTMGSAFVVAAIAIWLTGGLAGIAIPAFTVLDPSPLVGLLFTMAAKISLISRAVYAIPGVGATSAVVTVGPRGGIAVTEPGTLGLVQKVAGTGTRTVAATTPTA